MVQINFALKEVSCKIVYYGPGLSGKTTNLQMIHEKMPAEHKGTLTSIATEGERTLFFDFMPLDLGSVAGMRTKFQLYTVPGQVYYNATRKLVLKGVDGVIFVADSQPDKMAENLASWQNLHENLAEHGLTFEDVPVVFQYNKRDVPDAVPVQLMTDRLNTIGAPWIEATAVEGEGVLTTLRAIAGLVLDRLNQRTAQGEAPADAGRAVATQAREAEASSSAGTTTATATAAPPRVQETVTSAQARRGRVRAPSRASAATPAGGAAGRRVPRNRSARPLVEDRIGSGSGSGRRQTGSSRARAWIAVAATVLVGFVAAAAAYVLWFRG